MVDHRFLVLKVVVIFTQSEKFEFHKHVPSNCKTLSDLFYTNRPHLSKAGMQGGEDRKVLNLQQKKAAVRVGGGSTLWGWGCAGRVGGGKTGGKCRSR